MSSEIITVTALSKKFTQNRENKGGKAYSWKILLKALTCKQEKKTEFYALRDINFSVCKGTSLGIIGLNGSGKTTLLQILAGTMKPTKGTVSVNGRVAALLELGSGFNPEFTGVENVYLSSSLYGLTKQETDSKFQSIADFAEIGDFITQPVKTYSSGMVLRLAFAVISHIEADILIIDEALAVGDARFQMRCFKYLLKFQKSKGTIILASHDLNSITQLCDYSLILMSGHLVQINKSINAVNEYTKIIDSLNHNTDECKLIKGSASSKTFSAEQKLKINKMSYGLMLGEIRNIKINNSKTALIKSGESFVISFKIHSFDNINDPIFAIRIRDIKGQEIYGTNTQFLDVQTPTLEKGDEYKIKFTLQANFGPGNYLISIGFTCYDNDNLKVIHRLRECLEFEIYNENEFFGISNCFSKFFMEHD